MNGILIDAESGDLLVQHSSVVIGDTDSQIAEGVLVSMRGEWKECPLIGGEVTKMLGGHVDVMWRGEVKKMLEACGLEVQRISVSEDNVITVEWWKSRQRTGRACWIWPYRRLAAWRLRSGSRRPTT